MTLPKKPSRDIEVEGKTFRWMVKRVGPRTNGTVRLTVENPDTGEVKQRLFRGYGIPGEEAFEPPSVGPADVKQFIYEGFDVSPS